MEKKTKKKTASIEDYECVCVCAQQTRPGGCSEAKRSYLGKRRRKELAS